MRTRTKIGAVVLAGLATAGGIVYYFGSGPAFPAHTQIVQAGQPGDIAWINLVNAETFQSDQYGSGIGPANFSTTGSKARSQLTIDSLGGEFTWQFDPQSTRSLMGLGNNDDESLSGIDDLDFAFQRIDSSVSILERGVVVESGLERFGVDEIDYSIEITPQGDVLYKVNGTIVHTTINSPKVFPYYLVWKYLPPPPAPSPTAQPSASPKLPMCKWNQFIGEPPTCLCVGTVFKGRCRG